jgi:hypothetical protein
MENLVTSVIICPQCAGENQINVDDKFIECQFCGSAIYIDKSKVVTRYVVKSNFQKEAAEGNLRRWMAGNFQVKNLDTLAVIQDVRFYYFPMWYFKTDGAGEAIYFQPATSTAISEIKKISVPAGNMLVYNSKDFNEKEFLQPDIPYDTALSWLKQSGVNPDNLELASLVHVPFYQFKYLYEGQVYTALVEASSGMIYANLWPAKSEAPYRIVFTLSIILFLAISVLSFVIGNALSASRTEFVGEAIIFKILLYGLASIPLIIVAYVIAKKV